MASSSGESLPTTLLRRNIGRTFRRLRTGAGLSIEQVAAQLDRARVTIGRIEQGVETVRFRDSDVREMLALYNAPPEIGEQLLALTRETRRATDSWWHGYAREGVLSETLRQFIALEDAAETISDYEPELVPGLLQTRDYARAVLSTPDGHLAEEELDLRVRVRMDRQSVLRRPRAPRLDAILNEAVIRRAVGSAETMVAQLELLLAASTQNNISLRIVPFAAGIHGGAVSGAFCLMEFPSVLDGEPPVVYTDTIAGTLYHNGPDDVDAYRRIWRHIDERALDEEETRNLIGSALKGFQE